MEINEREFYDDASSYDEILDFDSILIEDDTEEEEIIPGEIRFYRSLDEY